MTVELVGGTPELRSLAMSELTETKLANEAKSPQLNETSRPFSTPFLAVISRGRQALTQSSRGPRVESATRPHDGVYLYYKAAKMMPNSALWRAHC